MLEHLLHFIKDLKQVGAIAPSSKFLAKDLVKQLKKEVSCQGCPSLNILEIGPGTGPLTKEIASHIRPKDHLDVVEIHDHFFEVVKSKYHRSNISIHHEDIIRFNNGRTYDYIFSSLPYEAMPEEVIQKIWKKKLELCSPKAYICYFKYVSFRKFKCNFEEAVVEKYQSNKKVVFLNLPPAKLFTLEINNEGAESLIENVA